MERNLIAVNKSRLVGRLALVALFLILASILGQAIVYALYDGQKLTIPLFIEDIDLAWWFFVDNEKNVPTAFSVFLLLIAALLLIGISHLSTKQDDPTAIYWKVLAIGFCFMSLDEAWSFHERLVTPIRSIAGEFAHGFFYFAWVIPAIFLITLLGLFFAKFMRKLDKKTMYRFTLAAAIYLGGCIGTELLGGRYSELYGSDNFTYTMIATLEESLEMGGIILFIRALLEYISETYGGIQLAFSGS